MKQNIFPSDHSDETRRRDITEDLVQKILKRKRKMRANLEFVFAALSKQNGLSEFKVVKWT